MKKDVKDNFYELMFEDVAWMTQKGKVIDIKDMDKMHVFNTIRLLQTRNNQLEERGKPLYEIPKLLIESYNKFREEMPEYFI